MFKSIKDGSHTEALEQAVENMFANCYNGEGPTEDPSFVIKIHATHSILVNMRLPELRFDYRWPIKKVKE